MFTPAPIFSDHMILSRRKEIRIFGAADEGSLITGTMNGQTSTAQAADGRFLMIFPPMEAAVDLTLSLTDGETEYTFTDVAVGDVFLAGGQSNMELELQNADEGRKLIESHNDPLLRSFYVPKVPHLSEEFIRNERQHSCWKLCQPGEIKEVSAVAYFFALKVRREQNVPVGIIGCNWGGTSASCWIEKEVLEQNAAGKVYLDLYNEQAGDKTEEQYDRELAEYEKINAAWSKRVDELKQINPEIAWVDVIKEAGDCPWPPPMGCKSPYRPAGLAETMLKRVAPYGVTAFLFYQGEEDTARPEWYEMLLTTMVLYWRKLFRDPEIPFLNVQLPVFKNFGEEDYSNWGDLRYQQWKVSRHLSHSGLAVTIDLGELGNIHPTDKRTVGERLYQVAKPVVYNQPGETSVYATGRYPQGGSLMITLSGKVQEKGEASAYFEVAGADGRFCKAEAELLGDRILLTADGVPHPVKARYAHLNYVTVNLFGENGLPLAPFVLE
ncbi:MAG: sialate O-acetylesterase [Clostridia bacterium]|nr:sialate O-acetylesterase [Clostridia bacterium]